MGGVIRIKNFDGIPVGHRDDSSLDFNFIVVVIITIGPRLLVTVMFAGTAIGMATGSIQAARVGAGR